MIIYRWGIYIKALSDTKTPIRRMHQLKHKMKKQGLLNLLLVWLLLTAPKYTLRKIKVQANESVHFNLQPRQPSYRTRNVLPAWAEGKRLRKSPSGPNPVGNHQPPSKQ
ncbi:CLAVATA3/ESR (CLE)-related protein 46 [Carica papaya]|uniref:CLAVATA3/ESR (CLE)-related protein 46 n=1 Tax=Carica papaya TaxID=3649 RepID=UPI000B8C7D5B|nr:CLAVATA3/ESR (CLE)-related protein 46 [Carica papaya]